MPAGGGGGEVSACRALGLTDPHAVWDLAANARVFVEAVASFLEERGEEVGSAQVCVWWGEIRGSELDGVDDGCL